MRVVLSRNLSAVAVCDVTADIFMLSCVLLYIFMHIRHENFIWQCRCKDILLDGRKDKYIVQICIFV